MTSWIKRTPYHTETRRIVNGELKITVCCCDAPGARPKECALVQRHKTPCRCDCHRGKTGPKAEGGS